tara:strand:- start:204 stop:1016 length:813 start_codon:yes stop_codon:yes gene_type:complete
MSQNRGKDNMSTAQEKEQAIINAVKNATSKVNFFARKLAGTVGAKVVSAYERDKIQRQLGAAKKRQAAADAAYRTFQRQSAKSMKSLASIKASTPTPTATPTPRPRNTAAALNQGMKKPKPKATPKNISPKAKKAINKAAAALTQSQIKNKPTPKTTKPPADTSGFAKARAAGAKTRAAASKTPPTPIAKPKLPPKKLARNTSAALRQGMKDTVKLKTTLRAARAAGQLFYKDPATGEKKAAVLKSDLKPGQSLGDYLNKKQRLTKKEGK